MHKFENKIPFDPGYSKLSFPFSQQIAFVASGYAQQKIQNQKKFQLIRLEPMIIDLIDKSSAFFLGCLLWGAFISSRFPEGRELEGNTTEGLSEEELKNLDCAIEAKSILEFISYFERDCQYLLKRTSKLNPQIRKILEAYVEFAKLNNNFIGVNKTNQVKLPKELSHFEHLSVQKLDELCESIYSIIDSGRIDALLDLSFYNR
jgi:hypothetical protein